MIKTNLFILGLALAAIPAFSQSKEWVHGLPHFTKIVASPRINVVLKKGDHESICISANNIDPANVVVKVTGNKLHIFLPHARIVEGHVRIHRRDHPEWENRYKNVSVTAVVTYRQLREIEVRGDQEMVCEDEIVTPKLKIRAYGEAEISLASLQTTKLKASFYGQNHLRIQRGGAERQVFRLFGENKIDTRGLQSERASTRIYGEGHLKVNVSDQIHINAIGEPDIYVTGTPHISRGIVIGRADIHRKQ